ncbi:MULTISPECIES: SDR family oxidoreductase [Sphingobium]|uniref:SDR family oxidoreductase n=1 Tax=Sphingobium TaxID=165695 RepID=UPI00159C90BE|nr:MULTISPECIES: SDR family oxidoreductase [unclassified Sphingobium]
MGSTRRAVITGSASGIGKATAERLTDAGWRVIGIDLRDAEVVADLSTAEGRSGALRSVSTICPDGIDTLVTCAGIYRPIDSPGIVSINYFGTVDIIRGLRSLLLKSASPRVAAVSSMATILDVDEEVVTACTAGDEVHACRAAVAAAARCPEEPIIYSSTKRAITNWIRSQSVADDWGGSGILLNCVCPGVIRTPLTRDDLSDPARMEWLLNYNPAVIKDIPGPDVVASLLAYLVSAENAYMVGQAIFVDGGTEVRQRI